MKKSVEIVFEELLRAKSLLSRSTNAGNDAMANEYFKQAERCVEIAEAAANLSLDADLEVYNLDSSGEADTGGSWKTLDGVHVYIKGGVIEKGPAAITGKKVDDLPPRSKPVTQSEHQAKSHEHVAKLFEEKSKPRPDKAKIAEHSKAVEYHQGHADELKRKNDAEKAKPKEETPKSANTKAPWQMTPEEYSKSGIKTFKTAQGSLYAHANGQTIRVKTPHLGHETADVGLKSGSSATHYVDPEDARKIGMWNTMSNSGKKITKEGGSLVLSSLNPKTGARGIDERISIKSHEPSVGLSPVELTHPSSSGGYNGNHPGNAITEVSGPTPESHAHFVAAAKNAGKPSRIPEKPQLEVQSAGAVPVDAEVKHAGKSGKLTVPVGADGKIDPHLEAAYRRHAEKQGLEISEFKSDGGGTATAKTFPKKPALEVAPRDELNKVREQRVAKQKELAGKKRELQDKKDHLEKTKAANDAHAKTVADLKEKIGKANATRKAAEAETARNLGLPEGSKVNAPTSMLPANERRYLAGQNRGSLKFTNQHHEDLFDAGNAINKGMNIPKAAEDRLLQHFGGDEGAMESAATKTYKDAKEQAKGLKEGESRSIKNRVMPDKPKLEVAEKPPTKARLCTTATCRAR